MTGTIFNLVREYLVLGLDVARRRWRLFFLPIVLALPVAFAAGKMTPKKYTAKSLILLQSSNSGGTTQQYVIEQVMAIEAWLKSDQVLRQLLPSIMKIEDPNDPQKMSVLLKVARNSISLTLLGGSALEVSLTSSKPYGLGKKLEAVLTRIMQGLTGPERGIFNAPQFVLLAREEAINDTRDALTQAISSLDIESSERIQDLLKQLYMMRPLELDSQGGLNLPATPISTSTNNQLGDLGAEKRRLEQQISEDPEIVKDLIQKYTAYQQAIDAHRSLNERLSNSGSNYVGLIGFVENLLVIGRPQDPIFGESPGKKIAVAIMLLSIMGSAGLVWLFELFYSGVHTKAEFEELSGLPVVTRFQRLPPAKT